MNETLKTGIDEDLVSCHICEKVSHVSENHCPRCHAPLHSRKVDSIQRCLAFALAGMIAYVPANTLPIMVVTQLGNDEPSTILGGVATFWAMGAYPVAIIIFIASVMIPGLKFLALGFLCAAALGKFQMPPPLANRIYFTTELVGRWSMVDVFVVAILVSLIHMGELMTIRPGPAAIAFAATVILTMIAAHNFDPKLIWDQSRKNTPRNDQP